jgi:hypothetical protein
LAILLLIGLPLVGASIAAKHGISALVGVAGGVGVWAVLVVGYIAFDEWWVRRLMARARDEKSSSRAMPVSRDDTD